MRPIVKFVDVDPNDIPMIREGRRGRVSYPILKAFLETGAAVKMLDRTGMQQGLMSINSSLNAYIRNHQLPIRIFTSKGEVYLARTDTDDEGNPDPKHNDIRNIPRGDSAYGMRHIDETGDIPDLEGNDLDEPEAE